MSIGQICSINRCPCCELGILLLSYLARWDRYIKRYAIRWILFNSESSGYFASPWECWNCQQLLALFFSNELCVFLYFKLGILVSPWISWSTCLESRSTWCFSLWVISWIHFRGVSFFLFLWYRSTLFDQIKLLVRQSPRACLSEKKQHVF